MQTFHLPGGEPAMRPAALSFAQDGRLLVVRGWNLLLLDTTDGQWLPPVKPYMCQHVRFVQGGAALAYLDPATTLVVLDLQSRESKRYALPEALGRGLVATSDGRTLYLLVHLSDKPGSAIWEFDTANLGRRGVVARQKGTPWYFCGSPDGRWVATRGDASGEPMRVWDATAISRPDAPGVAIFPKGRIDDFALAHDGSRLATVSTRGLTVWDAATGEELVHSGKHRRGVSAVACHPSKPLIVTGDNAGAVFLWDHGGRVLTRYDWGLGNVNGLAFSPDGLRCAAADNTGKVVIWDVDA